MSGGNMRRLKYVIPLVVLLALLVSSVAFAAPAQAGGYWYTVRWGDTLFSIGRASGVNPWAIASANSLWNPNAIFAGQQLWIPNGGWGNPPPWHGGCGYWRPVNFGDTLFSISRATGVWTWRIAAANGLGNQNLIYAGQSLWIPCR
jgi:LysM repeat protein